MASGILAVVIGYLLGSIPTAYLVTRLAGREDIRRLGSGNIGGLNTFSQVGIRAGLSVLLLDLGKGAGTVAVAYWWLGLSQPWVLAAAFASVVGHMWMLFLKFSGGRGMAATVGALFTLLPLYGYWQGLLIFVGIIIIPMVVTRNIAFTMGVGLIAIALILWLGVHLPALALWVAVTTLVMGLKFFSTAKAAFARSRRLKDFIIYRGQQEKR